MNMSAIARSWALKNMIFDMISFVVHSDRSSDLIESPYIRQLLMYQIRHTPTRIVYDLDLLVNEYGFLRQVFIKDINRLIPNIANLCNLFPRADDVVIEVPMTFEISQEFVDSLISDAPAIGKNVNLELQWPTGSEEHVQANWFKMLQQDAKLSTKGIVIRESTKQCQILFSLTETIPHTEESIEVAREISLTESNVSDDGPKDNNSDFGEIEYLDNIFVQEKVDEQEPESIHFAVGKLFDFFSIMVSLLDFGTDLYILAEWYSQNENVFFWIGTSILITAQLSYVAMFYGFHPPESTWGLLLSLLCSFWCIPFYSIILFFSMDESSCLRKWEYLKWDTLYDDTDLSLMSRYLRKKLYKNMGFVLEAMLEALPMSILQLSYIVVNTNPNAIAIASILISMLSVCSKCFLMIFTIFRTKSTLNKLWLWFCFVVDFIGIFFIVSVTFYSWVLLNRKFCGKRCSGFRVQGFRV